MGSDSPLLSSCLVLSLAQTTGPQNTRSSAPMAATETAAQERRRSAGAAPGDSPTAGTASPKRVSFAPPPPPLRPASTATSPLRRPMRHVMLPPSLALDSGSGLSMLSSAADHSLVFIPEVDSPRRHSTLRPLGAYPRWPSNDVSLLLLLRIRRLAAVGRFAVRFASLHGCQVSAHGCGCPFNPSMWHSIASRCLCP
jgi:hypothetical protein